MKLAAYTRKCKEVAERLANAMAQQNMKAIESILRDSSELEREWIAQSPYRAGVKVRIDGRDGKLLEDPTTTINRGAIVCLVKFEDGTTETVGIIPETK